MRDFDLRALQLKEFEMLEDFKKFCDDNGIVYYLMYGTLIGAARHQGFIPWDDDIDVIMDTKNYRKFLRRARKKYPEKYFIQNFRTEHNMWYNWTKIRINGTTSMERNMSDMDIHYGVCMDIFVMAGKPEKTFGIKLVNKARDIEDILLRKYYAKMTGAKISKRAERLYRIIPEFLRIPVCRLLERIIYVDTHSREYCYCPLMPGGFNPIYKSESFENGKGKYLMYEGKEYRVPYNWEDVLERRYGDWRTPPPESEREGHGDIIVDLENDYKTYYTGK